MKSIFIFTYLLILCFPLFSQSAFPFEKRDYVWLTGYSSNPTNLDFGGTRIDFNQFPPIVSYEFREMDLDVTNDMICDENGALLMYANGTYIANSEDITIENGDSLNPNNNAVAQERLQQSNLFLPIPESQNQFILINAELTYVENLYGVPWAVLTLYKSIIDMNENNGLGKVIEKNIPIVQDTLDYGQITATRHANGRDWWIIAAEYRSNRFYTFLLCPEGLIEQEIQEVGGFIPSGLGQTIFSPDGTKYVHLNSISASVGSYLAIYDFDRCTGQLSNFKRIFFSDGSVWGLAISPSSQYLYLCSSTKIEQYDFWADSLELSRDRVALYDGYVSPLSTDFTFAQLAPDNKIYIAPSNTVNRMHIIHRPDIGGDSCRVEQHGLELPTLNSVTIPNNPNFRLGPLDGSPCDTLGISNVPYARFTYEVQDDLTVRFRDLSVFEPYIWVWNFGDSSNGTTEVHPTYTFEDFGTYEVCLSVTNDNGMDTHCEMIVLENPNAVSSIEEEKKIQVYPNPATDYTRLMLNRPLKQKGIFQLYDALGRVVKTWQLPKGYSDYRFRLNALTAALYFYRFEREDGKVDSGKLLIQ